MDFRMMVPTSLRKMILHAGQQRRHRCKEQTFGLSGRRRGWDDLENSTETCALPSVKYTTSASSRQEAGHPEPVLWDNPEGWGGEEGGRGVQDAGGHMYTGGRFMLMCGKNHHNIVIILQPK